MKCLTVHLMGPQDNFQHWDFEVFTVSWHIHSWRTVKNTKLLVESQTMFMPYLGIHHSVGFCKLTAHRSREQLTLLQSGYRNFEGRKEKWKPNKQAKRNIMLMFFLEKMCLKTMSNAPSAHHCLSPGTLHKITPLTQIPLTSHQSTYL